MAISTGTQAIGGFYKGVTPFQERAMASAQKRYDTVNDTLNQSQLLISNYNKHNADEATEIEQEYANKVNELSKGLRTSGDASRVSRELAQLKSAYSSDLRIKDLGILKEQYNLDKVQAASAKDADTRQRAFQELDKTYAAGTLNEDGRYNLTPAQGLTYYDLPAIANAGKQYSALKKDSGGTTSLINGRTIKTVLSPNGDTSYHVVGSTSTSGVDEKEVYDSLEKVIMSDPTVSGYLKQVKRRGGKALEDVYKKQFITQLEGVSELASHKITNTVDKTLGSVDNRKTFEDSSAEDLSASILEDPNNAGINQVVVPSTNEYESFEQLDSANTESNTKLAEMRENIMFDEAKEGQGVLAYNPPNQIGIPVPGDAPKIGRINLDKLPMMKQPDGSAAVMTAEQASRYNNLVGQQNKVNRDYNAIKRKALKSAKTSNADFNSYNKFVASSPEEKEDQLDYSYDLYKKRRMDNMNRSNQRTELLDFDDWAMSAYESKNDYDNEKVQKALQESMDKTTYSTVNRNFVTVSGIKGSLGGSTYNKTSDTFKNVIGTSDNRETRYAESPEDILANANNIILQTADDKAVNVSFSDEDFEERIFEGTEADLEEGVTYKQLGYDYDAEEGGIEKVQVTGKTSAGKNINKLIYVQDEDVDKVAGYVTTKGKSMAAYATDFKASFKGSDVLAYSSPYGDLQYVFDKNTDGTYDYNLTTNRTDAGAEEAVSAQNISLEKAIRLMAGIQTKLVLEFKAIKKGKNTREEFNIKESQPTF